MMLSDPYAIEPGTKCENCGEREATERWVGSGGTLALTHGMSEQWCEVCVLEKQLEHARERAEEIPKLEEKLERLREP